MQPYSSTNMATIYTISNRSIYAKIIFVYVYVCTYVCVHIKSSIALPTPAKQNTGDDSFVDNNVVYSYTDSTIHAEYILTQRIKDERHSS